MRLIKAEGRPSVVSQHSFQGWDPRTNCSLGTEILTADAEGPWPERGRAHTPAG